MNARHWALTLIFGSLMLAAALSLIMPDFRHDLPPQLRALETELAEARSHFAGLALDRVGVVSPFDTRFRYNVYSSLKILAAHQRRHLWLAERIRMDQAGAGAMEVPI